MIINPDISVSLIVATYNNPRFLKLCINSILNQTVLPSEIVIADDGSTEETNQLILSLKKISTIPIFHIWQPDNGFRLGAIRNIAIAAAKGDYIIQIDGDLILEKHFIQDHIYHIRPHTLLQGPRVLISEEKTALIIENKNQVNLSIFSSGINHRENALRSKIVSNYLATRYRNKYPVYYARGCNMSFFKEDFVAINGYDEDFVGWGHEDSDLTLRMLNSGIKKHYIKFHCVEFHLFHKEAKGEEESINKMLLKKHFQEKKIICENGISKYLNNYNMYIK